MLPPSKLSRVYRPLRRSFSLHVVGLRKKFVPNHHSAQRYEIHSLCRIASKYVSSNAVAIKSKKSLIKKFDGIKWFLSNEGRATSMFNHPHNIIIIAFLLYSSSSERRRISRCFEPPKGNNYPEGS